jgi:hypothetical protein
MHENLWIPAAIAGQLNEGGPVQGPKDQATARSRSPNSRCRNLAKPVNHHYENEVSDRDCQGRKTEEEL